MKVHDHKKTGASLRRYNQERFNEDNKDVEKGVDCRCKEAEGKTFPHLLKIMVKDLAFWKKDNR